MLYRVIGLMSGSSLDGLDIVYTELIEKSGAWSYQIQQTACYPYSYELSQRLKNATTLSASDYLELHVEFGSHMGQEVNRFMEEHGLHFQVQLIASHGHTTFHKPVKKMTAQLGDGAAIAAATQVNVISDLRSMDIALGGQGAPIVPIGEKLLFSEFDLFLNLGGIANLSAHFAKPGNPQVQDSGFVAFDICPANRVLNLLAGEVAMDFDQDGSIASKGLINQGLLDKLNGLDYYSQPYPKSLANDFGTGLVFPMVRATETNIANGMRTYVEHICAQISRSLESLQAEGRFAPTGARLLATGGGVHNGFLMQRLKERLPQLGIQMVVPPGELADFKEALVMALIGVLRWREEKNVLSSVTGASRDSVGGAVWIGQTT
jgi:anhydro-N-acetylmuramic acid kinase